MAETVEQDGGVLLPESVAMRRLSRALSRTATFTQEISDTVNYLVDINGGVEAAFMEEEKAQAVLKQEKMEPLVESASGEAAAAQTAATQEFTANVGKNMFNPDKIMMRDKIVFFFGVINVCLIAFWLGKSPSTYYHYWALKCFVLFPLRWWIYRKKGMHYLMLELCYFGNFLGIAHVYLCPTSVALRQCFFAYGSGPLLFSILAMRNSLVFHDFDKTTTLMMHASPALTAWTLRWYPLPSWTSSLTPVQVANFASSGWRELLLVPLGFYFIWMVFYYVLTFVLLRNRIEGRGLKTMFSLMVPRDPEAAKRSPLARMVLKASPSVQPFMYLGCHGLAASISFLPVPLFWNHFWLHTIALLGCLAMCVYNGGSYYFKVFATKYVAQLQAEAAASATALKAKRS